MAEKPVDVFVTEFMKAIPESWSKFEGSTNRDLAKAMGIALQAVLEAHGIRMPPAGLNPKPKDAPK